MAWARSGDEIYSEKRGKNGIISTKHFLWILLAVISSGDDLRTCGCERRQRNEVIHPVGFQNGSSARKVKNSVARDGLSTQRIEDGHIFGDPFVDLRISTLVAMA
jgi:hypothetical protein